MWQVKFNERFCFRRFRILFNFEQLSGPYQNHPLRALTTSRQNSAVNASDSGLSSLLSHRQTASPSTTLPPSNCASVFEQISWRILTEGPWNRRPARLECISSAKKIPKMQKKSENSACLRVSKTLTITINPKSFNWSTYYLERSETQKYRAVNRLHRAKRKVEIRRFSPIFYHD